MVVVKCTVVVMQCGVWTQRPLASRPVGTRRLVLSNKALSCRVATHISTFHAHRSKQPVSSSAVACRVACGMRFPYHWSIMHESADCLLAKCKVHVCDRQCRAPARWVSAFFTNPFPTRPPARPPTHHLTTRGCFISLRSDVRRSSEPGQSLRTNRGAAGRAEQVPRTRRCTGSL
jgi:hypothetical protein